MPQFSPEERDRLHLLVEAVRQIEDASIVAEGKRLSMRGSITSTGLLEEEFDLFASEAFRSLAMSVRLVYMSGEPANFGGICNLLYRHDEHDLREAVTALRTAYNDFLKGPMVRFSLHGEFEGITVGPKEIFETWLYSDTFHQDPKRRAFHAELKKFGARFTFGLHVVVTQIVQFILELGYIVRTALAEEVKAQGSSPPAT